MYTYTLPHYVHASILHVCRQAQLDTHNRYRNVSAIRNLFTTRAKTEYGET